MQIYDTARRAVVPLEPRTPGEVSIYNCGPTVYDAAHVGHARNAVVVDVLRRYLRYRGYKVHYVSNFTDVDDKIILRAAERDEDADALASRYVEGWRFDMARLNVEEPDVAPKATLHVSEMIEMIERLVEREHAYAAGGDVYFAVDSFPAYGSLSNRKTDEMQAGARVTPGDHKRNPLDFALWKAAKPGEPSWESPWGTGRPGWHIECSAMAEKYLGRGFDIHAGGVDLVFPHHENEKAQSEAATDDEVPFARMWVHNGLLNNVDGTKMSKSGTMVTIGSLLDSEPAGAVRLVLLQTHYRRPSDFSLDLMREGTVAWSRLANVRRRLADAAAGAGPVGAPPLAKAAFIAAMDDDLNTAEAVAACFELVRTANLALDHGAEPAKAADLLNELDELTTVLGLTFTEREPDAELLNSMADLLADYGSAATMVDGLDQMVEEALEIRTAARVARDYATSDAVRDRLEALGIVVKDAATGSTWHRE